MVNMARKDELAKIEKLRAEGVEYANIIIPNIPPMDTLAWVKVEIEEAVKWSSYWSEAGEKAKTVNIGLEDVVAILDVNTPAFLDSATGKPYTERALEIKRADFLGRIREILYNGDMIWPFSSDKEALEAVQIALDK